MPKISTEIDRKAASRLLGVSLRTIDRYISYGKLTAYSKRGRVWLNREDVLNFNGDLDKKNIKIVDLSQKPHDFYKNLYEESRRALIEYQQKLEQANYRIGQLESQMTNVQIRPHVAQRPPERRDDFWSSELAKREFADREKEIEVLKRLCKKERTNRLVFTVLTYGLLLLLPLMWYLLR